MQHLDLQQPPYSFYLQNKYIAPSCVFCGYHEESDKCGCVFWERIENAPMFCEIFSNNSTEFVQDA